MKTDRVLKGQTIQWVKYEKQRITLSDRNRNTEGDGFGFIYSFICLFSKHSRIPFKLKNLVLCWDIS